MCSNRCRKRLPHRLRRKTLRIGNRFAADGRSKACTCSRGALWLRTGGLGFQFFLSDHFATAGGPVRSRNGRHYLGRDSGDQRSRCHPELPASGGTFHCILAHGGAGGMFARGTALSGTVVGAAGLLAKRCRWWIPNKLHGCAGNQGRRFPPDTPCSKKPCSPKRTKPTPTTVSTPTTTG